MEKEFLEQCLAKGMSLPQIGELVGRPPGTVGYWVAKHGLVANGKQKFSQKGPLDRDQLEALLESELTLEAIAERLGVPISRVRYSIEQHQLPKTVYARRVATIRAARKAGLKEIELVCPAHGRTPFWIGKKTIRCRKCNTAGVTKRRRKVKEILVAEAGGCCAVCGFDRSPVALEFHHLDPSEKKFAVSQAGVTRSIASTREEAAKCVLLCANCHAMVEAGVIDVSLP